MPCLTSNSISSKAIASMASTLSFRTSFKAILNLVNSLKKNLRIFRSPFSIEPVPVDNYCTIPSLTHGLLPKNILLKFSNGFPFLFTERHSFRFLLPSSVFASSAQLPSWVSPNLQAVLGFSVMGMSPSKRVENALRNSTSFEAAIVRAYNECMDLAQHAFPGLRPYQLLDASARVYNFMAARPDDAASKMRHRWIPEPPTQFEIDDTLRKENLAYAGKTTLNLEEFRLFSLALFRDMVVSNSCRTMVWYAPMGVMAVLCSHLTAQRLPVIGPKYRTLGPVLPKIMVGYAIGAAAAFYLNLTG